MIFSSWKLKVGGDHRRPFPAPATAVAHRIVCHASHAGYDDGQKRDSRRRRWPAATYWLGASTGSHKKTKTNTRRGMEALVCASHGAMASLLRKLGDLLSDEYKLLTRVKGDIMFLKAELESMHAFLKRMSEVEDPDELSKCWIKEVRELSYDIEDGIDNFMLSLGVDSSYKPRGFKGLVGRCMDLLTNSKTRHWIAKKIKVLKHGAMEVSSRRARYKVDGVVSRMSRTSIDPRLPAFFTEMTRLVGIDGPRDKLIKLLTEGEGALVQQLKVASIVGSGGLGKTTLANQVYQKLEGQFECQAFVSVSQTPNLKKILRNILFQICWQERISNKQWDEQQLISAIRQILKDKRLGRWRPWRML